jgi:hypothetical protein
MKLFTHLVVTAAVMIVMALAVSGCKSDLTRPDQQAFDLDVKVTAAAGAVSGYAALENCATNGDVQPCAKTSVLKKIAKPTRELSDAMDAYENSIRQSGGAGDVVLRQQVEAALAALNKLLLELGLIAATGG